MAYTTGDEVKLEVETPLEAAEIEATFIPEAEAVIDAVCGHDFNLHEDQVEVFNGDGETVLLLTNTPVVSVSQVSVSGSVVPSTSYVVKGAKITLKVGTFTKGVGNVEVTYDHGYATVPSPIARACRLLAANYILQRQQVDYEKQVDAELATVNFAGYTAAKADGLTTGDDAIDALLRPYMKPKVGAV